MCRVLRGQEIGCDWAGRKSPSRRAIRHFASSFFGTETLAENEMDPSSPVTAYQALGHVWIVPLLVALFGMALVTGFLVIDALNTHR